jgi:hypothetical protein
LHVAVREYLYRSDPFRFTADNHNIFQLLRITGASPKMMYTRTALNKLHVSTRTRELAWKVASTAKQLILNARSRSHHVYWLRCQSDSGHLRARHCAAARAAGVDVVRTGALLSAAAARTAAACARYALA